MKKIGLAILALGVMVPTLNAQAATKVSTLKVGNQDYSATILKDTVAFNRETYTLPPAKQKTQLKAGSKVVVTKHKLIKGYNFLVLKGNRYIPADDALIEINDALKSNIDYDKSHLTARAKCLIKQSAKKKYAKQYKSFLTILDKDYQNWMAKKEDAKFLSMVGQTVPITSEGRELITYDQWFKKNMPKIKYNPAPKDTVKVDILSDQFMKDFINSKNNIVRGHKIGEKAVDVNKDYKIKDYMVTFMGLFQYGNNAGFEVDNKTGKVSKLIYVPSKTVTYEQIIKKYGQPKATASSNKTVLEHILTYDKSQYGYNVHVGLDSFKGNVKYIIKEAVKTK
ncbi:hypothetical protein ACMGE5_00400 [Macrococcus equi]|uniref:hypothetical protein n=1 Tax=Macrococcus equi TaxID=3395462 RepID=UPI0039BDB603